LRFVLFLDGKRVGSIQLDPPYQRGCSGLSPTQFQAYKRASLLVLPENGERVDEARQLLESVGLEVLIDRR